MTPRAEPRRELRDPRSRRRVPAAVAPRFRLERSCPSGSRFLVVTLAVHLALSLALGTRCLSFGTWQSHLLQPRERAVTVPAHDNLGGWFRDQRVDSLPRVGSLADRIPAKVRPQARSGCVSTLDTGCTPRGAVASRARSSRTPYARHPTFGQSERGGVALRVETARSPSKDPPPLGLDVVTAAAEEHARHRRSLPGSAGKQLPHSAYVSNRNALPKRMIPSTPAGGTTDDGGRRPIDCLCGGARAPGRSAPGPCRGAASRCRAGGVADTGCRLHQLALDTTPRSIAARASAERLVLRDVVQPERLEQGM